MNITTNNSFRLKSTNSFTGLQQYSLIHNKLNNVLKNSNIVSSNNDVDKLSLSKQASFKIKVNQLTANNTADIESVKADQMVENAMFSNLVGGFVNSTLDEFKTEIEDNLKSYSSYISKIDDGTLDKNISFDDYADSESKKKYQSNLANDINDLLNKTNTSTKAQEIEPSEITKSIDPVMEKVLQINHTSKDNSLHVNKIDHSPLDKSLSFNYYVNSENKNEYKASSINIINASVNKADTSIKVQTSESSTLTKVQEIKPSENTESVDTIKKQAFEQLQNRIKKIVDNSINSLNNIFKGITVSSPELSESINEIKQDVTSLTSSIKEINLNTKNQSEFGNSLKKIFQNINKTQSNIRNYLYTQFKNIPGLDNDYLNKLTYKFESETANNLKRSQYDINLIDSTFNSRS